VESHDTCFRQEIQNYTHEESGLQQFPKKMIQRKWMENSELFIFFWIQIMSSGLLRSSLLFAMKSTGVNFDFTLMLDERT